MEPKHIQLLCEGFGCPLLLRMNY